MPFGHSLLIILWSLTAAGTVFKIFFTGKYEVISTVIYLTMGWIMVAGGRKFFEHLPVYDLIIILAPEHIQPYACCKKRGAKAVISVAGIIHRKVPVLNGQVKRKVLLPLI